MPSYEKNKSSNLWSVRFRETTLTGTMNKRLSGYKTKKEAQYGYEDYIASKAKPSKIVSDILFEDLAFAFLNYKRTRIKSTSFYDVEKRVKNRILPFFQKMPVRQITAAVVLEWQNTLNGYSHQYKKTLTQQLSSIFNYGSRYHDIISPMKNVESLRDLEAKKEMLFWTEAEFSAFIHHVKRADYALFFKFLYITGCRRGEAIALKWSDLDTRRSIIKVTKNYSNKAHDDGKKYAIVTPKNLDSNRNIHLPPAMIKALLDFQEETEGEPSDFIFGKTKPFPPTSLDRAMATAAEAAGVKKIRIHDLRHSCVSLLISRNVPIVSISKQLGHKDIEQTLNTYAHMMPDDREKVIQTFEDVMKKW